MRMIGSMPSRLTQLALAAVLAVTGVTVFVPSPAEAAYPCSVRVNTSGSRFAYSIVGRGAYSGTYHFDVAYGTWRIRHHHYYTSARPYRGPRINDLDQVNGWTFYGGTWHRCNRHFEGD